MDNLIKTGKFEVLSPDPRFKEGYKRIKLDLPMYYANGKYILQYSLNLKQLSNTSFLDLDVIEFSKREGVHPSFFRFSSFFGKNRNEMIYSLLNDSVAEIKRKFVNFKNVNTNNIKKGIIRGIFGS